MLIVVEDVRHFVYPDRPSLPGKRLKARELQSLMCDENDDIVDLGELIWDRLNARHDAASVKAMIFVGTDPVQGHRPFGQCDQVLKLSDAVRHSINPFDDKQVSPARFSNSL